MAAPTATPPKGKHKKGDRKPLLIAAGIVALVFLVIKLRSGSSSASTTSGTAGQYYDANGNLYDASGNLLAPAYGTSDASGSGGTGSDTTSSDVTTAISDLGSQLDALTTYVATLTPGGSAAPASSTTPAATSSPQPVVTQPAAPVAPDPVTPTVIVTPSVIVPNPPSAPRAPVAVTSAPGTAQLAPQTQKLITESATAQKVLTHGAVGE